MMKHSKKVSGIILIIFLLPMLACNMPRSFLRSWYRSMTYEEYHEEEEKIYDEFGAIVVPDYYDSQYSCTINTGSFYDLYLEHRQSPYATTETSEIEFTLVSSYPNLFFDFLFYAIGTLEHVHPNGTFLGFQDWEHVESGEGTAIWEDGYFSGSISYDKLEINTYKGETREHRTSGEFPGIGALSPDGEEIHVCIQGIGLDQFDMVKALPFDQLRAACISNHYFICTPE